MAKKQKTSFRKSFENEIEQALEANEQLARKIWLAGMGVYSQAVDKVQERYQDINTESRSFIENLLEHGKEVEDQAKEILASTADKVRGTADEIKERADQMRDRAEDIADDIKEKTDKINPFANEPQLAEFKDEIQSRLSDIRGNISERLVLPHVITQFDWDKLNVKMDQLTDRVEELLGFQDKPKKTTASKKKTTKKKAAKKKVTKKKATKKKATKKKATKKTTKKVATRKKATKKKAAKKTASRKKATKKS